MKQVDLRCICGRAPHADWSYTRRQDITCEEWAVLYQICKSRMLDVGHWGPNAKRRRIAASLVERGLLHRHADYLEPSIYGMMAYDEARTARWQEMDRAG